MNIKYINNIIGISLFSIFLTGCQTMQPFQSLEKKEEQKTSIYSSSNISEHVENFSNTKQASKKLSESNKSYDGILSDEQPIKSFPIPEPSLARGGRTINPDPNVQLISPPTSIPKQKYAVPEVEQKEDYNPPSPTVHSKHTKDSKNKSKRAIAQKSSKTSKITTKQVVSKPSNTKTNKIEKSNKTQATTKQTKGKSVHTANKTAATKVVKKDDKSNKKTKKE